MRDGRICPSTNYVRLLVYRELHRDALIECFKRIYTVLRWNDDDCYWVFVEGVTAYNYRHDRHSFGGLIFHLSYEERRALLIYLEGSDPLTAGAIHLPDNY